MAYLPFAGKNSIVEVLLGLQFAQPLVSQITEKFEALQAEFTGDFPSFEKMQQVQVTIGNVQMGMPQIASPSAVQSVAGFNASLPKSDKTLLRVLRAVGNTASAHFLDYDHWRDTRNEALSYFQRCLQILNLPSLENPITGVQLTFMDRFTYDGPASEATAGQLLKPNAQFIPHNILTAHDRWQTNSIWSETSRDGNRTDHQVSIQGVVEANAAIVISHVQGTWLATPFKSMEELYGGAGQTLEKRYDEQHFANASMLKDLLSDAVLKQIGLN